MRRLTVVYEPSDQIRIVADRSEMQESLLRVDLLRRNVRNTVRSTLLLLLLVLSTAVDSVSVRQRSRRTFGWTRNRISRQGEETSRELDVVRSDVLLVDESLDGRWLIVAGGLEGV